MVLVMVIGFFFSFFLRFVLGLVPEGTRHWSLKTYWGLGGCDAGEGREKGKGQSFTSIWLQPWHLLGSKCFVL